MSGNQQPNIANSLIRIHLVITRALSIITEKSSSLDAGGFPEGTVRDGFVNYARCLCTTLDAHHRAEDELAFPYFQKLLPDAPYDRLSADHQAIVKILPRAEAALVQISAASNPHKRLGELNKAVTEIITIWQPHIQVEEKHFSAPILAQRMSVEEHIRMDKLLSEFSQQHAKPDALILPFVLYNLSGEQRAEMAKVLPSVVTEQLIPTVWKDQWASMMPFLLSQ